MIKITGTRSTGKTGRLLLLAKENNGVIVCENVETMKNKAYRYGLVGIDFISYKIYIDTIKEIVKLSNIQQEALDEIETIISEYMMQEKKRYVTERSV